MYKARTGRTVDGVVSIDPVALSSVLEGTGPVKTVGGRKLTSGDAVRLLLSQVYADIPNPDRQNVFFNAVARSVFDAVSTGQGSARAVVDSLATSASQRRVLVWSARPEEQQLLDPTALSGRLETSATDAPQVGVFFNAARPYKLDYYLDYVTSVRSVSCVNGRQHLKVTVDMRSRVPKAFRTLPSVRRPAGAAVRARHHRLHDLLLRAGGRRRARARGRRQEAAGGDAEPRTGDRSSPAPSPSTPAGGRPSPST